MNEITTKHSKLREKYDKKKTSLQEAEAVSPLGLSASSLLTS